MFACSRVSAVPTVVATKRQRTTIQHQHTDTTLSHFNYLTSVVQAKPCKTLNSRLSLQFNANARVTKVNAASNLEGADSVQLGTAKLPKGIDVAVFSATMFQWATTLTTSGQNMPFVLPQKVDKTETGFEMDFLKSNPNDPGSFVSVGTIEAKVEDIEDGSKILFLRGYGDVRVPKKLVDVPIVMQTMPNAIKRAITVSMP